MGRSYNTQSPSINKKQKTAKASLSVRSYRNENDSYKLDKEEALLESGEFSREGFGNWEADLPIGKCGGKVAVSLDETCRRLFE